MLGDFNIGVIESNSGNIGLRAETGSFTLGTLIAIDRTISLDAYDSILDRDNRPDANILSSNLNMVARNG